MLWFGRLGPASFPWTARARMTDTKELRADGDLVHTAPTPDPGLLFRLVGVLFSPRRTFSAIVKHPRSLGAMVAVVVVVGG